MNIAGATKSVPAEPPEVSFSHGAISKFFFHQRCTELSIPITPKIHAVFFHIEDFCSKQGVGLGYYSEQAVESSHFDFKKTFDNKYSIKPNHPDYEEHVQKALCEYNSLHI